MKNKLMTFRILGLLALHQFHLPAVAQPVATTMTATSVTTNSATLNGTVNPNEAETSANFEYGLTTDYDNQGGFITLPATNTTFVLPGLVVNELHGAAGEVWTKTSAHDTNYWQSIASSADGTHLAAVDSGDGYGGYIYRSTNAGATWTQTSAPFHGWVCIASSADGTHLAAGGLYIYTSTNGGVTWTQTSAPEQNWWSIASSADGTHLAAVQYGAGIYSSTDGGVTWTPAYVPAETWVSVASSADGTRFIAVSDSGFVFASTNAGATWMSMGEPAGVWESIASSADGMMLAGVQSNSYIFTSTDGGVTWNQSAGSPHTNWASIASSADGMRLTAGAWGGGLYTSIDGGITWAPSSKASANWASIASSADGTRLATVNYGGGIYTSTGATINLTPGTTYHYQVTSLNIEGAGAGRDMTFTIPAAPTAATLAASGATATNATLNGTVDPNGAVTSAYFRYGLTTSYGSYSTTNILAATNVNLSVSNLISSLEPGTTYHFQLVASNSAGTALGGDVVFTNTSAQAVSFSLHESMKLPGGSFRFSFTNLSGLSFTVLGTTNLALPWTNWNVLGSALESPAGSGNYQFTDFQATNNATGFYRVRSP
jgi:photosystem II stability/assembly factor-like uncharacterized protein